MKKVMISTVYSGTALGYAAHKLGVDKVYLLVTVPAHPESDRAVKEFRQRYKDLPVEIIKETIPQYDIAEGAQKIVKIIRKESKENEVYIHTSEGRKTMMLALLFAAYAEKKSVQAAYYVGSADHKGPMLIQLPLLEFRVRGNKKRILQELKSGNVKVMSMAKKLDIHKTMVYNHIKSLIRDGYLTEDWELTDAGKVVVL